MTREHGVASDERTVRGLDSAVGVDRAAASAHISDAYADATALRQTIGPLAHHAERPA